MQSSESIKTIAPAYLKAQKEIGGAVKGSVNPFFHSTYADLGSVMEACKEHLNENGISVLQPIGSDEKGVYVETVLLHESGEWLSDKMRIAPKSETNPQDQGSAISYARRYSLQSMVFIPAEDDDAEKVAGKARPANNEPIYVPPHKNTPQGNFKPQEAPTISSMALGNCPDCGAEKKLSKNGKPYCSAKCWLPIEER